MRSVNQFACEYKYIGEEEVETFQIVLICDYFAVK